MDKNKLIAIGIAIVVGLGAGFGVSFIDILKPYSALTGSITALVIAIVAIVRKPKETK